MSALVMGNLIHHGLEELYKPLVGKPLSVFDVDEWTQKALELGIERLVKEGYSESALYQGRNLVTLEVCKKMLDQFLHYDLLRSKAGKTILKGVETELEFEMQHPSLDLPLKFVGKVDRIEMTDGRLTVWDYKTGRMKPSELSLSTWEDLWNGKKPKALQCLLYAWLLWKSGAATSPLPWRIGMYKMQSPQPESLLRGGAFDDQVLGEQDLIEFEHQLMEFLVGQLSSDEPFVEPPPKDYYS
jgi:ATP-dependent helicase/DNAse subunit B